MSCRKHGFRETNTDRLHEVGVGGRPLSRRWAFCGRAEFFTHAEDPTGMLGSRSLTKHRYANTDYNMTVACSQMFTKSHAQSGWMSVQFTEGAVWSEALQCQFPFPNCNQYHLLLLNAYSNVYEYHYHSSPLGNVYKMTPKSTWRRLVSLNLQCNCSHR